MSRTGHFAMGVTRVKEHRVSGDKPPFTTASAWLAQQDVHDIQYWLFVITGFGTDLFTSPFVKFVYSTYNICWTTMFCTYAVFYTVDMGHNGIPSLQHFSLHAGTFLVSFGVSIKRCLLESHKQKINNLHWQLRRELAESSRIERRRRVVDDIRLEFRSAVIFLYILGGFTTILYLSAPAFNRSWQPPLPFPRVETIPDSVYTVTFVWECIVVIYTYLNFFSYDMIVCSFIARVSTRLGILADDWNQFGASFESVDYARHIPGYRDYDRDERYVAERERYDSFDVRLEYDPRLMRKTAEDVKDFVTAFHDITGQMRLIEEVFRIPLLFHMLGGSIVLSLMSAVAILGGASDENSNQLIGFCICTIIDLFMYCFYGTKLRVAMSKLRRSVYGCPWYEMDGPRSKYFLLLLQSLQKNFPFTGAGIISLDLETYLSLLKISYNFLALLQSAS